MFFFIMTTISIVGYGSYVISTDVRIAISILMFVSIYMLPTKSSDVVQLIGKRSAYARRDY